MLRDVLYAIATDSSPTSFMLDVTPQWNDKQRLLWAVEKMYEKITVIMPIVQSCHSQHTSSDVKMVSGNQEQPNAGSRFRKVRLTSQIQLILGTVLIPS